MLFFLRPALLAIVLFPGFPVLAAAERMGDEPTGEEVEILELMNRYRADPAAEAQRILTDDSLPGFFWNGVDRAMFKREVVALPPAPPLVFDLAALRAARLHSRYMVLHGLGHDEVAGKEGFTGVSFSDRMKAAGFTGAPGGENCFRDAGNAWQSHAGFIIDFGPGGSGGMQNGRGHRMNMANSRFTVVGPGAVPHGGKLSVTHKLGSIKTRFLGGAIYADRNGNGRFDAGEGRGGAVITIGAIQTRTWASGGYVLPLPAGGGDVTIQIGTISHRVAVPAGADNHHLSWAVPAAEELAAADRLIADVEGIPDEERQASRRRRALANLWIATRSLSLDAERNQRVETLASAVGAELRADQDAVLGAITAGDAAALREALKAARQWQGTLAKAWFDEAVILAKASDGVRGLEAARSAAKPVDPAQVKRLRDSLIQARDQASEPEIRSGFSALIGRVDA